MYVLNGRSQRRLADKMSPRLVHSSVKYQYRAENFIKDSSL